MKRLLTNGYTVQELIEAAAIVLRAAADDDPDEVDYRVALGLVEGARALLPLPDRDEDEEDAPPSGSIPAG